MIKIYKKEDFKSEFIDIVLEDKSVWNFDIRELDYLLKEYNEESFILLDNRLYEIDGWTFDYWLQKEVLENGNN